MSYSVDVTIYSDGATYHETIAQGDDIPGNVTASYGLADPLVIQQSLGKSDRLPLSHPDPDEATITLIAANASTYARMSLGDPVAVLVYPQASFVGTPVTFYGRIATLASQPVELGLSYTLGCVDYVPDLATLPVGSTSWPAQTAQNRLARIMNEAGLSYTLSGIMLTLDPTQAARSAGTSDALTELLALLDSWPLSRPQDEYGVNYTAGGSTNYLQLRARIVPNITAGRLDPAVPFSIVGGVPVTKRIRYAPPARISNLSGVRTVTVATADSSPSTGAPILSAARVRFAPGYTQDKGGNGVANVVQVTTPSSALTFDWRTVIGRQVAQVPGDSAYFPRVPYQMGGPAVVQQLETQGDSAGFGMGDVVYAWRVPFRPNLQASWTVGTLAWQAWAEPTAWRRPDLTELLTVAGVEPGTLPANREWVSGLVQATTLTVQRGRVVIELDLIPNTYDREIQRLVQGASLGVVSFNSPILSGVTLAQLAVRDTLDDYALVRGS